MFNEAGEQLRVESDAAMLIRAALWRITYAEPFVVVGLRCRNDERQGCVLWEVAPEPDGEADPEVRRLYVLGSHMPEAQHRAIHDLPLVNSITGRVVLEQTPREFDVESHPEEAEIDPFLARNRWILSAPVTFRDKSQGALNLYRDQEGPFDARAVVRLEAIAELLPDSTERSTIIWASLISRGGTRSSVRRRPVRPVRSCRWRRRRTCFKKSANAWRMFRCRRFRSICSIAAKFRCFCPISPRNRFTMNAWRAHWRRPVTKALLHRR